MPPLTGILFMGDGGNFRFLIYKNHQDALFVPIRGPIGSLTNFGPLWALRLSSPCFFAHSLIGMLSYLK